MEVISEEAFVAACRKVAEQSERASPGTTYGLNVLIAKWQNHNREIEEEAYKEECLSLFGKEARSSLTIDLSLLNEAKSAIETTWNDKDKLYKDLDDIRASLSDNSYVRMNAKSWQQIKDGFDRSYSCLWDELNGAYADEQHLQKRARQAERSETKGSERRRSSVSFDLPDRSKKRREEDGGESSRRYQTTLIEDDKTDYQGQESRATTSRKDSASGRLRGSTKTEDRKSSSSRRRSDDVPSSSGRPHRSHRSRRGRTPSPDPRYEGKGKEPAR